MFGYSATVLCPKLANYNSFMLLEYLKHLSTKHVILNLCDLRYIKFSVVYSLAILLLYKETVILLVFYYAFCCQILVL